MFKIAYRRVADVSPFVYLPGADGLTLGMAATLTSGALAKGTASVKRLTLSWVPSARTAITRLSR